MNILAVPHASAGRDAALAVAQSLAGRTGGRWGALHALRWTLADLWPVRRTRRVESLRRQLTASMESGPNPVSHRIVWRPLKSVIHREITRSAADLIVSHAFDAVDSGGNQLADLLESAQRPVLFVRRPWPRRVGKSVVVTTGREGHGDALRRARAWLHTLTESTAVDGEAPPLSLEVDVLLARTEEDGTWPTDVDPGGMLTEDPVGRITLGTAMPVGLRHVAGTVRLLEPDLVVLCGPFRPHDRGDARMVTDVLDGTEAPVLVLGPNRYESTSAGVAPKMSRVAVASGVG